MDDHLWLRAADCPLLQTSADDLDPAALRQVQRLLELCLARSTTCEELARCALEEIGVALTADRVALIDGPPSWQARWQYARRGQRLAAESWPTGLLGEALGRERGVACAPAAGQPALLVGPLASFRGVKHVLVVVRARDPFSRAELEFGVAACHYLGLALERAGAWDDQAQDSERLRGLVAIGQQLIQERETVPLLEHLAEQAARLLHCERAVVFLWDQVRKELVGRPAPGVSGGELRQPDGAGIIGKVVQTGQVMQVDDVYHDPGWTPEIDGGGAETRNLLCVPLTAPGGARLGALAVMNRKGSGFTPQDVQTLQALAGATTATVQNVREREALQRSNAQLEVEARAGARIIGESAATQAVRNSVAELAQTDLPVLILGERGTGTEVVARALHYSSARQRAPFIAVHCGALAEGVLEIELFGQDKSTFSGGPQRHAGKFEAASGGTLFLDEVSDLSPPGQARLLRVLEEKVVVRVGRMHPDPVDVRVVAATSHNLAEAVRTARFRRDLFYRLNVVTIDLKPLRERREDVLVLADFFLEQFCREAGRRPPKFSAEVRRRLEHHNWPGNVRELRNLLERVAYLCPHDRVEVGDLAFVLGPGEGQEAGRYAGLSLAEAKEVFEREHIQRAIDKAGRNMSEAAKLLGLHRPNLYRKMKDLKMEVS